MLAIKDPGNLCNIAMNLPISQKFGALHARNHTQNPSLFTELQVVLKANQVVAFGAKIFLSQLHYGPGRDGVLGSSKPTGFIGPKRNVSRPRFASSSIGRQASKNGIFSSKCDS